MLRIILLFFTLITLCDLLGQPFGNAINLNGTSNYIEIPNSSVLSISDNLVLEAWINPCNITGNQMLYSKVHCVNNQNAYYLSVFNGKLRWVWFNNNCGIPGSIYESNNTVVTPGNWQHIAVKHTYNGVFLYLNGQPVPGSLIQGSYGNLKIVSEPISVGAYKPLNGSMTFFFNGQMDELRIWNADIPNAQILNQHNTTLSGNEPNLLGYYPLDQTFIGPNQTLPNHSNNTNASVNALTKSTNPNTGPFFQSGNHAFILGNDSVICHSNPITLNTGITNYNATWNNSVNSNTFSASAPSITTLQLSNSCNLLFDSITLSLDSIPQVSVSADTTICLSDTISIWGSTTSGSSIWSTGDTLNTILVTQPDSYSYYASNSCGQDSEIVVIHLDTNQMITLGLDTSICSSDSIPISVSGVFDSLLWSTNDTNASITGYANNIYWVNGINSCGFSADTIYIDSIASPIIHLGPDTSICLGETITASTTYASNIYWNTNDTSHSITPQISGTYVLTGTNVCSSSSDTLHLMLKYPPVFSLGPDTTIYNHNSYTIYPNISNVSYMWSDSTSLPYLEVSSDGEYILTATQDACQYSDTIIIQFNNQSASIFIPNVFTPNNDGMNDLFTLSNVEQVTHLTISIFNRWGIQVFQSESKYFEWNGFSNTGSLLPSGEYFYILQYSELNGQHNHFNGTVTLIN